MKKYFSVIFIAVLAMAMMLTSCENSSFSCSSIEDKNMVVEAQNAGTDMEFMSGGLIVAEGEELHFVSSLEKGTIQLDFRPAGEVDMDADPEEIAAIEPTISTTVGTGEDFNMGIDPGEYTIQASVVDKATGTVEVTVVASEEEGVPGIEWDAAESTEDAGEKADIGLFLCDPQGTSLGPVTNADYEYIDGVARAHYGLGAVDMYVYKGYATINDGDISYDDNDYANEWTWDIDGTEVKCFGNREGEATKAIWTKDIYAYAICAYGAGGDDDYGLSQEDFTTVFKDLQ